VPKINKKIGEKWVDLVMLGFGVCVLKMGNEGKWGLAVGGGGWREAGGGE
jgi:hypothetical protein